MSRVIVRRRPDGIVQIRRRPAWRAIVGPIPAAILGFLVLSAVSLVGLATALVRFPFLLLLVAGAVALVLSAARFALHERAVVRHAHVSQPRPPSSAA